MKIPDYLIKSLLTLTLKVKYFDLRELSVYSSLKIPTLRYHIKSGELPCFKVKGKILVKRIEFDQWLEGHRFNKREDLNNIVDGVIDTLKE